jgi:hypothetical protein
MAAIEELLGWGDEFNSRRAAGEAWQKQRDDACTQLAFVLDHKPCLLPLSAEEKKLKQECDSQIRELRKRYPEPQSVIESAPTTTPAEASKAKAPQETYWSLKLTRPVELKNSVGRVVARLEEGQSAQYVGRDNYLARIRYQGTDYEIPISSTDLK